MTVSRDMAELFVNVTISNNGRYTTDEVVQIYGHKVQSAVKRPHRQLIDFRRVKQIRPGEKRTVTFHIPQDRMKYFDVISREMVLEDGMYEIYAGHPAQICRCGRRFLCGESPVVFATLENMHDCP